MKLSKNLLLGLALSLLPAAAFAQPVMPPPGQRVVASGHYEWRTVNQWVPGSYQQVLVPGRCRVRRHRSVCRAGFYRSVWRPGHYQPVNQKIWVADGWQYQNPGPFPPRYG
jgi:hypothetical protein